MAIKDVLVYVDNDSDCAERVVQAAALCKANGAYLSGAYTIQKMVMPAYVGAYIPANVIESREEETAAQCNAAKTLYEEKVTAAGVEHSFHVIEGEVEGILSTDSRYADLVIIPQRRDDMFDLNPYYELPDVLLGSAAPVLMLPSGASLAQPVERALLAWDGKRESARALSAALPGLLGEVKKVDVVTVSSEGVEAADIAVHIRRHGIEAEVHVFDESRSDAGRIILEQAGKLDSQLLVMGAYGHSRLREWVLGGATKHVISNAELPVFFAH